MKNYTQFVQELNEMFPGSKEYIAKFGKSQIKWSDDKEEKKPEADGEEAPKRGRGRPKGSYGSYKSHPENKGKYKGVHAARKAKVQEALEYMATLDESEYDEFLQSLDEELFGDIVEALDEELEYLDEASTAALWKKSVKDIHGKDVTFEDKKSTDRYSTPMIRAYDRHGNHVGYIEKKSGRSFVFKEPFDKKMLESLDIEEAKRTEVRDPKTGKVVKWKEEGDWHKATGDVVDKSGAKHGAYSKVRDLARKGIKKVTQEELEAMSAEEFDALVEDFDQLDELSKKTLASYINKATKDVAAKYAKQGEHTGKVGVSRWDPNARTHIDAGNKRKVNVYRAIDKIGGKNNETGSEVKGSVQSAATSAQSAAFDKAAGNKLHSKNLSNISKEHMGNVAKGVKKLAKEELETPVDVYTNFITEHKGA